MAVVPGRFADATTAALCEVDSDMAADVAREQRPIHKKYILAHLLLLYACCFLHLHAEQVAACCCML